MCAWACVRVSFHIVSVSARPFFRVKRVLRLRVVLCVTAAFVCVCCACKYPRRHTFRANVQPLRSKQTALLQGHAAQTHRQYAWIRTTQLAHSTCKASKHKQYHKRAR